MMETFLVKYFDAKTLGYTAVVPKLIFYYPRNARALTQYQGKTREGSDHCHARRDPDKGTRLTGHNQHLKAPIPIQHPPASFRKSLKVNSHSKPSTLLLQKPANICIGYPINGLSYQTTHKKYKISLTAKRGRKRGGGRVGINSALENDVTRYAFFFSRNTER